MACYSLFLANIINAYMQLENGLCRIIDAWFWNEEGACGSALLTNQLVYILLQGMLAVSCIANHEEPSSFMYFVNQLQIQ